jgi:DNA-binding winged helix-turn-helix (wHTH) protein/tetratricopeptide (TPR) repeat protein
MWQFPPFRLDAANQCLYRGETRVPLMPKPFAVLQYLVEHAGRLVTQNELLTAIWPETYVQPEVLRRYILEIRRVLGDQPEAPRFIETVPKRGYRFIAEVTVVEAETPINPAGPVNRHRAHPMLATAALLGFGLLVAGGFLWSRLQPTRLTGRDTIILAEFTNATGDPVFDGTLRQGLAVQLEQSPFLSIVSDEQIQQTLRLMRLPPDARLTLQVAREVCQRTDSTVLLSGSIAQIGARYSLILKAVSCSAGDSVASTEVQASDKSHVLEALSKATSSVRGKLGESLATIQRFDTPLAQASTSSLEALKVYSLGLHEAVANGNSLVAIPLLQRATKLDPNFAIAYLTLGHTYWNVGETTLAAENIRKAFELRAGLTEGEKLRIESAYTSLVINNLEKARRAYEVWAQTYPRDWTPRNHLGVIYTVLGQHERALAEYLAALRIYPDSGLIRGNVIFSYLALDRPDEARSVLNEAGTKNPDLPSLLVLRYRLAFLRRDFNVMKEQVTLAAGKPGLEAQMLANEAASAAYFGRSERARMLSRQAVESAGRADEKEAAAGFEADAALREALFGSVGAAKNCASAALQLSPGPDVQYRAALALALVGDRVPPRALAQLPRFWSAEVGLAENLDKRFPEDTIVQLMYLPVLRAQVCLNRDDASKAIDALQPALPYEVGAVLLPAYVRGLTYLAAHRGSDARAEFQKILDHRGVVFNSPIGALAHLQIARSLVMQGDSIGARSAYQEFLDLWKDADPDIPILRKARDESTKLSQ